MNRTYYNDKDSSVVLDKDGSIHLYKMSKKEALRLLEKAAFLIDSEMGDYVITQELHIKIEVDERTNVNDGEIRYARGSEPK